MVLPLYNLWPTVELILLDPTFSSEITTKLHAE